MSLLFITHIAFTAINTKPLVAVCLFVCLFVFSLQAIYNLAYMVEYNYSLNGIRWNNVDKDAVLRGNLTFAASLYEKCRDAQENNNESFLPCAFGVVRVKLKVFWQNKTIAAQAGALILTFFVGLFTLWTFFSSNDNGL